MDEKLRTEIAVTSECASLCNATIAHCLEMGGEHAEKEHITTMIDCAHVCELTAAFLARGSQFSNSLRKLCAQICERCADNCEQIAGDDEMMQRCVETCRRCARECMAMA